MASCVKIISILLLTLGSTRAAPSIESDFWTNPCYVNGTSNELKRHLRSTAERELNYFSNIVINQTFDELKMLYPNNTEFKNRVSNTCPRIHKMLRQIKRTKNKVNAQKKFYIAMFHFYKYLEKLENIRMSSEAQYDLNGRKNIYLSTKRRLRLTICEFNETFRQDFGPEPRVQNMQCIPDVADLTRIASYDIQFFKKLRKFLKLGKKMLRKWRRKHRKNEKVGVRARTRTNSS